MQINLGPHATCRTPIYMETRENRNKKLKH